MQLLVVAATELELSAVKKRLANVPNVDFAATGVGMLATAYTLTKLLSQKKYDWVFNVGIAGAFSEKMRLGEVVAVKNESIGDSGVENAEGVIAAYPKELQSDVVLNCPYVNEFSTLENVQQANGTTVNLLTENEMRVAQRSGSADVETMEGAAFFYVCKKENVNFLQLRGISNRVGERDKAKWKIAEAMESVSDLLVRCHSALDAESPNREIAD